ncbi:MAG: TetR/AcrR family transcriptional regulator [Flavonifractor plautii]
MESDVREKILETARCIFLKEGYKGTTINSIARAAGISPSTIYLHFNGKKDLFENLDISEEEALQDAYNANRTSILQTALILLGNTAMTGYLWICWPGSRAIPRPHSTSISRTKRSSTPLSCRRHRSISIF